MWRIRSRPLILAATVGFGFLALARLGVLATILVLALGVTAAFILPRQGRVREASAGRKGRTWRPSVQHKELPPPADDPLIAWAEPQLGEFGGRSLPLAHLPLKSGQRAELDGYALGRAKRMLEAPNLLSHAAADPESWPSVEAAVNRSHALLAACDVELLPDGLGRLNRALALCAAQGILLAEWRQLEDGKTAWDGATARVRSSDIFTIQRITESLQRQLLPDLFAGIARRPADFEIPLLVPFTLATAFYVRLRGEPPKAFAA